MPKKPKLADEIDEYLRISYPGRKPKPKFKVGQKVKFRRERMNNPPRTVQGSGVVKRVFRAYGNVPVNYEVDAFPDGILFEDELSLFRALPGKK